MFPFANNESLFCHEDMLGSPWRDDDSDQFESQRGETSCVLSALAFVETGDFDDIMRVLMEKEMNFMVGGGYLKRLQCSELGCARSRVVRWMVKAGEHFDFNPHTVTSAVNCLDRFLTSSSLDKPWKTWMIDLSSVGCLSIAAKFEEAQVPLPRDLQIEGLKNIFDSKTILRMEFTILETLQWRLRSVTAFDYVDVAIQQLGVASNSLHARVTELLLHSLTEIQFLEFAPSVVALSSIHCALEELLPTHSNSLNTKLCNSIPVDKQKLQRCYEFMEDVVVDPLCEPPSNSKSPPSPVAVTDQIDLQNERNVSKYIKEYIKKCGNSSQQ